MKRRIYFRLHGLSFQFLSGFFYNLSVENLHIKFRVFIMPCRQGGAGQLHVYNFK